MFSGVFLCPQVNQMCSDTIYTDLYYHIYLGYHSLSIEQGIFHILDDFIVMQRKFHAFHSKLGPIILLGLTSDIDI